MLYHGQCLKVSGLVCVLALLPGGDPEGGDPTSSEQCWPQGAHRTTTESLRRSLAPCQQHHMVGGLSISVVFSATRDLT